MAIIKKCSSSVLLIILKVSIKGHILRQSEQYLWNKLISQTYCWLENTHRVHNSQLPSLRNKKNFSNEQISDLHPYISYCQQIVIELVSC
jgi:hypothetical protein